MNLSTRRRNSLSNFEVAAIKALIAGREYSNQEIAGLINRARGDAASDVSARRITNIKNGQIKKYAAIPAAGSAEVDQFLAKTALPALRDDGPLGPARLAKLLPGKLGLPGSLAITETDQIECKKSVNFVMKTIAAFANNKGGYFVFGVENGTFNVLGLPADAAVALSLAPIPGAAEMISLLSCASKQATEKAGCRG